jgi:hypothetical protein
MVCLGSLGKGRSSAHGLLRICRQSAAVQLACGIKLYLRWVPSEINFADGPSRQEDVGVPESTQAAHVHRGLTRRMAKYFRLLAQGRRGVRLRHW